jgi:DNA-directed RNA polymerase subunit RPC12/RpoP
MGSTSEANSVTKVCCQCGKDVSSEKRLKDDRGYWCYNCHKADREARHPTMGICVDCSREVPEAALIDYDGTLVCKSCHEDRRQKRKFSPVSLHAHHKEDRRRLYVFVGIFVFLIAIIVLRKLHVLPDLW